MKGIKQQSVFLVEISQPTSEVDTGIKIDIFSDCF